MSDSSSSKGSSPVSEPMTLAEKLHRYKEYQSLENLHAYRHYHVPKGAIRNFRLLLQDYPNGLPSLMFDSAYYKKFRVNSTIKTWGFNSPMSMFRALNEIFYITPPQDTNYLVFPEYEQDFFLHDARKIDEVLKRSDELLKSASNDNFDLDLELNFVTLFIDKQCIPINDLLRKYKINHKEKIRFVAFGLNDLNEFVNFLVSRIPIEIEEGNLVFCEKKYQKWLDKFKARKDWETLTRLANLTHSIPNNVLLPDDRLKRLSIPLEILSNKNGPWKVLLTSWSSPGYMKLNLKGEEYDAALQELLDEMLNFYGDPECDYSLPIEFLVQGLICAVLDNNKEKGSTTYYRCEISKITDSEKIKVHMCDFGAEEIVKLSDLRFLSKEFATLPAQAVLAFLSGIKPASFDNKYTLEARNFLCPYSKVNYYLDCRFMNINTIKKHGKEFYPVVLVDKNDSSNLCLNIELVKTKHAKWASMADYERVTKSLNKKPIKHRLIPSKQNSTLEMINSVVTNGIS